MLEDGTNNLDRRVAQPSIPQTMAARESQVSVQPAEDAIANRSSAIDPP